MAAPVTRGIGSRGTTMAVAGGVAIVASLGLMWAEGRDAKKKEGAHSPYKEGHGLQNGSDVAMNSSDVSAAVSVPKPGKERLPSSAVPKST